MCFLTLGPCSSVFCTDVKDRWGSFEPSLCSQPACWCWQQKLTHLADIDHWHWCVCVSFWLSEFLTGSLTVIGLFGSSLSGHLYSQACPLCPVTFVILQTYTHTLTAVVQPLLWPSVSSSFGTYSVSPFSSFLSHLRPKVKLAIAEVTPH